jgi:hypothetical protein
VYPATQSETNEVFEGFREHVGTGRGGQHETPGTAYAWPGEVPLDDEGCEDMASTGACKWAHEQVPALVEVRCSQEWAKVTVNGEAGLACQWFVFVRDGEAGVDGTTQGGGYSPVSAMDAARKAVATYRERVSAKASVSAPAEKAVA